MGLPEERGRSGGGSGVREEAGARSRARSWSPPPEVSRSAHVPSLQRYRELHRRSLEEPREFWGDIAKEFYWKTPCPGPFLQYNFDVTKGKIFIEWMKGATTNICYNVLDRIVYEKKLGDKVAFYWEGNEPEETTQITYRELLVQVCHFSNVLRKQGICKGDRVAIYMPMIPELVVAMLACARLGALHSIVFAGFSSESLCERILDSSCSLLITTDAFYRGEKLVNLKELADEALEKCREKGFPVRCCIVVKHLGRAELGTGDSPSQSPPIKRPCPDVQGKLKKKPKRIWPQISWNEGVDMWWHELMQEAGDECEPEWCDAEDPLFILYTSGSTGKPKFEGIPTYPDTSRLWSIVDKYKVTKFYTAPTAIRLLMKFGDEPVTRHSRASLQVLGTVGEPINPEAWLWYHRVVGAQRCPIVDTFWQTETGGHMLTPLPGATPMKPGSATFPFFGVAPAVLNESGEELEGEAEGYLVFKQPWPGIMRTVYGNHERFETTYFKKFPGYYVTGDGCRRDQDGYYWITGRIDDMLNVSGHLLSTAEVESALVEHEAVAEAAVVGHPHPVKGECLYCFVTLCDGHTFSSTLTEELKKQIREKIGPIATPDYIQNAPSLPKTRSGKIMRRVLRKIAQNDHDLGDMSTVADPSVITQLFSHRCLTIQ
ncbi:acetyl-coenzyme A synthetase, cytoplasmic isoform X3 [Physeter macrocephalus]|uniref:Propionate--CoA ligase n=1 Tax=Physeter macrocephalus TaxID=9755 RepID=A0A455C225_PHYMC|nr:acetyl-coenzyme A synthetase, cytoplasmic isoform X3 [Physeter catodon]|eukprot:XP_028355365.1 acetyl-coenzyme A synthetase, cytoplasmic isoform X3 [Physeter catodon]